MAITLVGQGYKSIEEQHDYRISTETTYKGQEMPMDISKTKDSYDKEERPKCFNCNKYGHIVKEYQKRKEKDPRKCFRYKKVDHIAKDCKEKQPIKTRSIKEESDDEDKEKSFGKDSE